MGLPLLSTHSFLLVSRDISTEPKYSYSIWGALLASLSQHVVAPVVVVVFLSISVLLTVP